MPQQILDMGQWEIRVNDVFSMIRFSRMHHAKSLEYINEKIYSELNRKHGKVKPKAVYSAFMHGYVSGLIRAEHNRLYREFLEYCYIVNGVMYSTHKDSDKPKTEEFYARNQGNILADSPNGHVWKGSDKIYFGFEQK
jgi:hypothetical protein